MQWSYSILINLKQLMIYMAIKGNLILKDIADTLNELTNINETFARVSADNFNILLTYNKKRI